MEYLKLDFSLLFDPLSIFFLFTIALISIPSAVYSIGYMKGEYSPGRTVLAWLLFTGFVLSMALVVTVGNAFTFLIAWEAMSLISYFLVTFDNKNEKSVQAGTIYIVMTHIGTAFITVAILILYKYANSFEFQAMKAAVHTMPGHIKDLVFLFFFIGFGTKAGVVPLHIWLPYAHPQAPSHISSLMSGVMIKTAIYGILRFIICILGVQSLWWGNLVLIAALVSCIVGVMYALMENDLKRLLAYSSVENIGIILLGVGASMILLKANKPVIAILALCAGLYHLINHAVFKGLLFLCSGAVYKATGTRNMEKMGGLIKKMPWTAVSFLFGAMAISAIIPLNGFVSEWLMFQSLFLGAVAGSIGYKIFMSISAALLALTGGLAASCFVKAFGMVFLAMPRSKRAEEAIEAPMTMIVPLVFLSSLTIVFGLAASFIIGLLVKVSGCVTGINISEINFSLNNFTLSSQGAHGVYSSGPLAIFAIILIAVFAILGMRLGLGKNKVTKSDTWGCGYYDLDARTEYTGTAFSKPFRIAFNFFLLPYSKTEKIRDSHYHVKSFKYEVFTTPVFKRYIYEPALSFIFKTAHFMRRIQPGIINIYIAYILATILLLIMFAGKF
ncbi:MAG: proton-conducting transporter membrane subunit [Candidatus Omnitrophota bacterium]|nr:proton-conducting transporter membrane subunit [Candidatus Omnitrophota bacterium]